MPTVAVGGGLTGDGSTANPLAVDFGAISGNTQSGRFREGEDAATSSSIGTTPNDATASGGKVRFGAASSGTPGTLWRVQKAEAGGLIGNSQTLVTARVKVTNNLSSSVLANLKCGAIRAGTSTFTDVGTPTPIRPNEFTSGQWRAIDIVCDFLPDDVDQYVGVLDFVPSITDLSLDYVRTTPRVASTSVANWGWLPSCTPLNNLRTPGWNNVLLRSALYSNATCTSNVNGPTACHEFCAAECFRTGSNCGSCCGVTTYYTTGVVSALLYK